MLACLFVGPRVCMFGWSLNAFAFVLSRVCVGGPRVCSFVCLFLRLFACLFDGLIGCLLDCAFSLVCDCFDVCVCGC